MSKINKSPQASNSALIQQQYTQITESAYLPATEAERYEALFPGFTQHLIENVISERQHRHQLENKVQLANIVIGYIEAIKRVISPIIAGITIVGFSFIVYFGFANGHPIEATTLAGCISSIVFGLRWLESKK